MIEEKLTSLNITDYKLYGSKIAKINVDYKNKNHGKLVLVTSINPTPYGEGKTTTVIGLCDSLNKIGVKTMASLREPSMGPVFGKKGGAIGGGLAKIKPENEINLNFTGDFHAITYANNLIAAVIDNHIYQGNELKIDKVVFNRCIDVNDRSLRRVTINGKETSFILTPASEIMSIIGLSESTLELRENLGNIIVGYTKDNREIYVKDLKMVDSLLYILEDAFKPNLVLTNYNNPVLVHTGPFANISYGCSSIRSIKMALAMSDYVVTEAGFGSDTGAIKYFDLLSRKGNLKTHAVVINATIRALKYHGNGILEDGLCNLEYHISNMKKFSDNVIVSLNKYDDDNEEEIEVLRKYLDNLNIKLCISTMYSDGENGCISLANEITNMKDNTKSYSIYDINDSLEEKLNKIKNLYYCNNFIISEEIKNKINMIDKKLPICICKTPYSITDDSKLLGFPKGKDLTITDIKLYNGAAYIVIYLGNVLLLPGLAKESNYINFKYE